MPHALSWRALGVSESWFYKWHDRPLTPRQQRREKLDEAVAKVFTGSHGRYGSPRVYDALVEGGWRVSEKTVAASMARQGLVARPKRRFRSLTRQDKAAKPVPDLLKRDFRSRGAGREVVRGPYRTAHRRRQALPVLGARPGQPAHRRVLIGEHHDARLARSSLLMAAAHPRRRCERGNSPLRQGVGVGHPPSNDLNVTCQSGRGSSRPRGREIKAASFIVRLPPGRMASRSVDTRFIRSDSASTVFGVLGAKLLTSAATKP